MFNLIQMSISPKLPVKKTKKTAEKGFLKNPFFYFGFLPFVLFGLLFFSSSDLAQLSDSSLVGSAFFNPLLGTASAEGTDIFFNQNTARALETPDLKIIQDQFVYGVSTPRVLSTQTLGSIMGGNSQTQERKEVTDYAVQPGDTLQSIAQNFNISLNTLLWANGLSKNADLKTGQNLVILPVTGILHVVKAGDTINDVAKTYKTKVDDIIAFNNLTGEGDIFIGDVLVVPGGTMPAKATGPAQTSLADSFFIYPAEGKITQGLHYYNAVDLANQCGTPVYAAAAGTVQRAVSNGGWNFGMGNHITILHQGGIVTYYGHLLSLFVKPGDQVSVGDRIALMGRTGEATGCHVHFQVMGAKNPLAKYLVGTVLKYK